MSTIVGRLHGVLDLDATGFDAGLARADISLASFVEKLRGVERAIRNIAIGMTVGITVPVVAVGAASVRTAGDFEASMNRVKSALYGIRPDQLEALSQAALEMGPAVGKSATEAADGIEMLAKNGLSASQIMDGALNESLKLSALSFADLGASADLVTDIMAQFGKDAEQLSPVVDRIAGALNVSKFGFEDYAGAMAQAGGVAGGLGVSFEDMNVALAATSSMFSSGSDAGTSFKTFLLRLGNDSKPARAEIEKYGLSFFDAEKNMRSMGEIAEELRTKLGHLNDEDLGDALNAIFGDDAIRTAISLMRQGAGGLEELRKQIEQVSAAEQVATAQSGYNKSIADKAHAFENLRIAIANGGLLQALTLINRAVTSVVSALSNLPQPIYAVATAFALLGAAIGPLALVALTLAKVVIPLLLMRFSGFGLVLGLLLNPLGLLARALGSLAISLGAARIGAILLGTALRAMLGPISLVILGLTSLYFWQTRVAEATEAARKAGDAASDSLMKQRQLTDQLAVATGKLRQELLAKARVELNTATADQAEAQRELAKARRAMLQARGTQQSAASVSRFGYLPTANGPTKEQEEAAAEVRRRAETLRDVAARRAGYATAIAAPAFVPPEPNIPAPDAEKGDGGAAASGRSAKEIEADYERQMRSLVAQTLSARASMATTAEERAEIEHRLLNDEVKTTREEIDANDELSTARKDRLKSELDFYEAAARSRIDAEMNDRLIDEEIAIKQDVLRAQRDALSALESIATTEAERERLQLAILDKDIDAERLAAQGVLRKALTNETEKKLAQANLDLLDQKRAQEADVIAQRNAGPLEAWRRSIPRTAAEVNEAFENIAVNGIRNMNDALGEAAARVLKLKGFAGELFNQLISDLIKFQIQQATSGSGGLLGSLFKVATSVLGLSTGSVSNNPSAGLPSYDEGSWPGFDIGGSFRVAGLPGIDSNVMSINGAPVAKVGQGEKVIVSPNRGSNDNGAMRVEVVKGDLFDAIVTRISADVAAPMSLASGAHARGSAVADVGRAQSRRIPGSF